jgi:hypothetical protein
MTPEIGSAARTAFFGLLLLLVDLRIGALDVLNDILGAGLVLSALVQVRRAGAADDPDARGAWTRARAWWVAALVAVAAAEVALWAGVTEAAAAAGFAGGSHSRTGAVLSLLQLTLLPAQLLLIGRFAGLADSDRLRTSWATSRRWFLALAVPFSLLGALADVVTLVTGRGWAAQVTGIAAVLVAAVVVLVLVGFAHTLVSLHRTARDAGRPAPALGPDAT